jgi:phage terminase small subunit
MVERRALTPKRQRFVAEYLVDLNAAKAYRRAGYAGNDNVCAVEGYRLLSNPIIAAAIAEGREIQAQRTGITADKVIAELARIGFSDIRKAVKWHSQTNVAAIDSDADMQALVEEGALRFAVANQVELINSDEIDDDTAAAISEISMSATGAIKVKLHDKRAALVDLGRHLGIFTGDGVNVNVNVGIGLGAFYGDGG